MNLLETIKLSNAEKQFALQTASIDLSIVLASCAHPKSQYEFLFRSLPFNEALDQCVDIAKYYVERQIEQTVETEEMMNSFINNKPVGMPSKNQTLQL